MLAPWRLPACVAILAGVAGLLLRASPQPTAIPAPATPAPAQVVPAALRLMRIRECRSALEPGVARDAAALFSDSGPQAGDWLTFDLVLDGAPATSRIMSVELVSASARDNLGTDLVAPILAGAGNDPGRFSERSLLMHDSAPSIRWFVAAPPRAAAFVEGTLVVRLQVAAAQDTVVINPAGDWQAFAHASLVPLHAEYRWSAMDPLGPYLEVRPRAAAPFIYSIRPRPPQFNSRAHFSSADRNGMSYLLAKNTAEHAAVTVQIMSDIRTFEATLELARHDLPR